MNNKVINLNDFRKNKDKEQQKVTDEYLEPTKKKDRFDIAMEKLTPEEHLELQKFLFEH